MYTYFPHNIFYYQFSFNNKYYMTIKDIRAKKENVRILYGPCVYYCDIYLNMKVMDELDKKSKFYWSNFERLI